MKAIRRYLKRLHERIKENRTVFIVYTLLRIMVVIALIRSIIIQHYESTLVCVLTLALLIIPSFLEGALKIRIAPLLEGILYCFIFAALILGELDNYYTAIPVWDTLLHTLNGFLFAAVGFCTLDLLNQNSDNVKLSPLYLVMVAFCFSMTIGVIWEFIECAGDLFFGQDMQKDFIVQNFQSVTLDPTGTQQAISVHDIVHTQITTASGEIFEIEGGYLDIGILDTMKDLFVNFIGAVIFCIFGALYLRKKSGKVASAVVEGLRIEAAKDSESPAKQEPLPHEEISRDSGSRAASGGGISECRGGVVNSNYYSQLLLVRP